MESTLLNLTSFVLAAGLVELPLPAFNQLAGKSLEASDLVQWYTFPIALVGLLALCIALATVSYQSIKAALANPVDALKNE